MNQLIHIEPSHGVQKKERREIPTLIYAHAVKNVSCLEFKLQRFRSTSLAHFLKASRSRAF